MKTLRNSTPGVSGRVGRAGLVRPALVVAVMAMACVPAHGADGMGNPFFAQATGPGNQPQPVSSMPGQVTQPLPGQVVQSLSGQLVGLLPGQLVPALPGQVVRALPGQMTGMLPGQRQYSLPGATVRSLPGMATRQQPNPIRPTKSGP